MLGEQKNLDRANTWVIVVTFVLFALALVTKGFTHDLLLEAGVFLVSVKLILATYNIKRISQQINSKLDRIEASIDKSTKL